MPERAASTRFWEAAPCAAITSAASKPSPEPAPQRYRPRTATYLTVLPNVRLLLDDMDLSQLERDEQAELSEALDVLASTLKRLSAAHSKDRHKEAPDV